MQNLTWQIKWEDKALKQLRKIDKPKQNIIKQFIIDKIIDYPRLYGCPLKGKKSEFWRYRIGDYRIICKLKDFEVMVIVVSVGHRKDIYD